MKPKPTPRLRRLLAILAHRAYAARRDARLRELYAARARGERLAPEIVSGLP